MPQAYRLTWPQGIALTLRAHKVELEAIEARAPDAAAEAMVKQAHRVAQLVVDALETRGVFGPRESSRRAESRSQLSPKAPLHRRGSTAKGGLRKARQ